MAMKSVSPIRVIRKKFKSREGGEEQSKEMGTTTTNIAIIRVRYFGKGTAKALAEELERVLQAEGDGVMPPSPQQHLQQGIGAKIEEIVIDLRHNKGGNLQEAIAAASLFLEPGSPVTYLIDSASSRLESSATTKTKGNNGSGERRRCLPPLVVLVDGATASAAEVFTAALHDNCRAVVIGRRTYGKARIQSIFQLSDGSGLQLTVGGYMTPNHDDINKRGILPDIELTPFESKAESRIPSPGTVMRMLEEAASQGGAQ
mmetsp:Transcript_15999/g.22453  ORF Transcript_15999/g.22453 Transcript_15999/m.22453 type:complete len:259 (-) Transcript_15999:107-883(-)|eukprot:CAMPEP_0185268056 /NCGR_PEP_ID=MMETSP1359-20130426/36055_1 /TAXON_ID=552665 /ORGANISM="Bigelowiella longifila, Strain CCMP242" /LENGTH=258 /DNA_ID=CAMNT_0027858673 /DNA_START=135 /DNA_END=911 /DNA_ORIENTATION=+